MKNLYGTNKMLLWWSGLCIWLILWWVQRARVRSLGVPHIFFIIRHGYYTIKCLCRQNWKAVPGFSKIKHVCCLCVYHQFVKKINSFLVVHHNLLSLASKREDPTKKSGTGGFDVKNGGPISTADKENDI